MRVELEYATLRRGDRDVLHVAHLVLPPAAVVALVGPNGSGKTTLLETLGLLRRPAFGVLRVDGVDPFSTRSLLVRARRAVTLVLQEPYLFAGTARSNVELPLRIRRVPRRERRRLADEALDATGAASLAGRPSSHLSAGERQRVAIARALAASPRVLLLDEPFAHLDPDGVERVRNVLKRVASIQGGSVVFSSPPAVFPERSFDVRFDLYGARLHPAFEDSMSRFNPERSAAR